MRLKHFYMILCLNLSTGELLVSNADAVGAFDGKYFRGKGDVEYLQLLDIARRMFDPDPEFQSMPMLYTPNWNGMVEGPTWGAWWIQNSYGPTYCALPFAQEPLVTFLQNAQDLWFDQMGDGRRVGGGDWKWVGPDGCLCDAASPGWIFYKQGDGRIEIHDWGMEFTAAGLVLQSELLLISRDAQAISHYLPKLERVANFIETRRDPQNNLFLAGPAGNLLAPSYAGWKKPDGTYDKAYLTGLSVTYIAGLDRLIELEKLSGNAEKTRLYSNRRDLARKGLPLLTTDEGYFVKYMDPDGTKHGVYGAPKHGYFEAICNHDAICFRVADDKQAMKIYDKIASIPGLRRHDLIITNCPSLDDMYVEPTGLWEFGRWVNGGHWSTCEARMIMGYYRLGKFEDARRSMERILSFAKRYRLDNNLTNFGSEVYQPNEPVNTVYDTWGVPAAMVRGLFEYLYRAEGLTILPHIPTGITELEQRFPIRFGSKLLYLATAGSGPVTAVRVNGKAWKSHDEKSVFLPYEKTPDVARLLIMMGRAKVPRTSPAEPSAVKASQAVEPPLPDDLAALEARVAQVRAFSAQLEKEFPQERYLAGHAQLAVDWMAAIHERRRLQAAGRIQALKEPASQGAADRLFLDTGNRLCDGLSKVLTAFGKSKDPGRKRILKLWLEHAETPGWYNIRSSGSSQNFSRKEDHMHMTLRGKAEDSCGWACDLAEPLVVPKGSQLIVDVCGSEGARYFVDLMTPEGGGCFQTKWQDSPRERRAVPFDLPDGLRVGQIILYTMTKATDASNDFYRVDLQSSEGKVLFPFLNPPAAKAR